MALDYMYDDSETKRMAAARLGSPKSGLLGGEGRRGMSGSSWPRRHPYLILGAVVLVYLLLDVLGHCLYPWEIRIARGELPAGLHEAAAQAKSEDRFLLRLGPMACPGFFARLFVIVAEMEYVFLLSAAVLTGAVAASRREGGLLR